MRLFYVFFFSCGILAADDASTTDSIYSQNVPAPQDPLIIGTLYQMGCHLYQVLKKNNIRCWLEGGGLLGLVRHGGMIPWDDDLDFCIHPDDIHKLKEPKVIHDLQTLGMTIADYFFGAKVFPIANHPLGLDKESLKTPFIDIFFSLRTRKDGKKIFHYKHPQARVWWPSSYFPEDELFDNNGSIPEYQFGPIILPGPKNLLPYLERQYGPNCLKEVYQEYDHIRLKGIQKIIRPLKDASAAEYVFWEGLPAVDH